jgi:hypothetical protein
MHLDFTSPRIVEKLRSDPNAISRGLGKIIMKKTEAKNLLTMSFLLIDKFLYLILTIGQLGDFLAVLQYHDTADLNLSQGTC